MQRGKDNLMDALVLNNHSPPKETSCYKLHTSFHDTISEGISHEECIQEMQNLAEKLGIEIKNVEENGYVTFVVNATEEQINEFERKCSSSVATSNEKCTEEKNSGHTTNDR